MPDAEILNKYGNGDSYRTARRGKSLFPTLSFFCRLGWGPLRSLHNLAVEGKCDDAEWARHSAWFADLLEEIGCDITVEGMDVIDSHAGPCVFVANHMSTLETFMLPGIIRPRKKVTFIVKESLVTMPYFGPVMRSRYPVVVRRKNPREDLKVTLTEGKARLADGISIIVFPQHTRSAVFEPENFNSIGEKLAARAAVPVIPIALKTNAWGRGTWIRELARIRPEIPVRVRFGELFPNADDRQIHAKICDFIKKSLSEWQDADGNVK